MLGFKNYLTEAKKRNKKKAEEEKHYNKVFMGKMDIEDDKADKYTKVFMGKKPIDEAFMNDEDKPGGRTFEARNALHAKLKRRYSFGKKVPKGKEPALDDPHGDMKMAIRRYTGSMYRKINKAHYNGEVDSLDAYHKDVTENLKKALVKHKTGEDMTVHTGIKRDPRQMEEHEGVIKMRMPAFTSTSIATYNAKDFARPSNAPDGAEEGHIVHIDVPKGSHGAYVAHHSNVPDEHEFILHPDAKVHVHPEPLQVKEGTSWNGKKERIFHWKGRLVHDGIKEV